MALYLGTDKVSLNFRGVPHSINMIAAALILNGAMLLSSDDYVLKDINGIYLTVKESE